LEKQVNKINGQDILDKIGPLLENAPEKILFKDYQTLFLKAKERYLMEIK